MANKTLVMAILGTSAKEVCVLNLEQLRYFVEVQNVVIQMVDLP
jgi:hypothetical protein